MPSLLSGISDRYKVFLFVCIISLSAMLLVIFAKDTKSAVLLAIVIGMVLMMGKPLWFSSKYGDTSVRILSLSIATSAVVAFVGWRAFLEDFLKANLKESYPSFVPQNQELMAAMIFTFLVIVIYIVNSRLSHDNTGMGIHPDDIDKDIPEPTFQSRLYSVCEALTDDLKIIDNKTNWSTHLFTPLDAEVEVDTRNGKNRKVTDLLKAIKRSNKRLFLVLGAPGAGKSVALRKLCQDLSSEVKSTGKIPVYVNLREWHVTEKWSENNPPTLDQLVEFVKSNVMNRDIVTTKFFNKHFDRLYETGRLYFVFDSFDEIPEVLNEKENSELIQQLSKVIFKFLKGARQESQGILASRMFRKPTVDFHTEVTLEIRPFTEEKIIQTFQNAGSFDENIVKKLFMRRPELVPVARNPFSAVLISEYYEKNDGNLPPNQSEMYQSYINSTLNNCINRITQKGLKIDEVSSHTIEIASLMFEHYGLEAPVSELTERLPSTPVEDVIDILKFARLGRAGSGDDNVFSFSHRRFTEYFTVKKLIKENKKIEFDAIPTDSQWRDALVLYCEVVDESKATEIAKFCWEVIKNKNDLSNPQVMHSLRFLRDAFRGRPECVVSFKSDLGDYFGKMIHENNDVLSIQLVVDSLPLLEGDSINKNINRALDLDNSIINDSSISIYRNLSKISDGLLKNISRKLNNKNIIETVKNRKSILFSLSLSENLSSIKRNLKLRIFSFFSVLFLFLFLVCFFYKISMVLFLLMLLVFIVIKLIYLNKSQEADLLLTKMNFFGGLSVLISISILTFLLSGNEVVGDGSKKAVKIADPTQEIALNNYCDQHQCFSIFRYFLSKDDVKASESSIVVEKAVEVEVIAWAGAVDGLNANETAPEQPIKMMSTTQRYVAMGLAFSLLILTIYSCFYSFLLLIKDVILELNFSKIILGLVSVFGAIILLILGVFSLGGLLSFLPEDPLGKYEYLFIELLVVLFSLVFLKFILSGLVDYIATNNNIRRINYDKMKRKEAIYAFFTDSDRSEKERIAVVSYLERSIKLPKGDWPHTDILYAKNRDDSFIRLAKLEQKWREVSS